MTATLTSFRSLIELAVASVEEEISQSLEQKKFDVLLHLHSRLEGLRHGLMRISIALQNCGRPHADAREEHQLLNVKLEEDYATCTAARAVAISEQRWADVVAANARAGAFATLAKTSAQSQGKRERL